MLILYNNIKDKDKRGLKIMLKINSLLGFEKGKKPMQIEKLKGDLLSTYRASSVLYPTQINFLIEHIKKGYIVQEEVFTKYVKNRSTGEYEEREKKEYQLFNAELNLYYTLTKTMFNFGSYLINNNLMDNIDSIIEKDNKRIEEQQRKELLKVEEEKRIKEEQQQKEEEFNNWLHDETLNYDTENNEEKINILKNVFSKLDKYPLYRIIEFIILVDNFDNKISKNKLISRLSYFNTCSLKAFECLTSIKLGNTDKEIKSRLNSISSKDFKGIKEYKERITKEVEEVEFYMYVENGKHELKKGIEYKNKELEIYIIKDNGKYKAVEGITGVIITATATKGELMEILKNLMKDSNKLILIKNQINKFIEKGIKAPTKVA